MMSWANYKSFVNKMFSILLILLSLLHGLNVINVTTAMGETCRLFTLTVYKCVTNSESEECLLKEAREIYLSVLDPTSMHPK